jgi:hypothetical protein
MRSSISTSVAGLILLLVLGWYIDRLAHKEIAQATRLLVYVLTFTILTALAAILLLTILLFHERLLKERASRKVIERESKVMYLVAEEGQQVYIRDTDKNANWRNAHLDGRIYANGQLTIPNQAEFIAWQTYMLRHRPNVMSTATAQLLPPQTQINLLAALDSVQRCLIVGASDSGKTTLLQWLVVHRLQTSKVIVIDPHAYPEKWPNCVVVGTGRNYLEIGKALDALVRLMTKRYEEIGKGTVAEQAHPRITILIDEWRAIVYNVKNASEAIKALLTESRKAAFSVFVATHSDRAKPLGLEGEYDLKDGFAIVRLSVINGQRLATLDTGNGEVPAILPGVHPSQRPQVIDADDFINLEADPTPGEAQILALYTSGASFNEIARQVYGHTGGKQVNQIKEVIAKFNQQ